MDSVQNQLLDYIRLDSSMAVLTVAADGTILEANETACKLAGKALESSSIRTFFTDFNRDFDFDRILSDGIRRRLLNVTTANHLPQTLHFTSFRSGEGILLLGEFDVLEIEEMRKTILDTNEELNNVARQLQKQNAQLEQLNRLKNQFLGIAAHDLRNPIASILMYSDFVLDTQKEGLNADLSEILDMIKTSSEFMLRLLEELLDVVKIESGKLELKMETVDLERFLRKIVSLNQIIANRKQIRITWNIPQPIPGLSFDPVKMEQVVNNLLSNAIKYSHAGTTVTIGAFSTDNDVVISIRDEGQGIPAGEIEKLFTTFAKISVASTDGEKSTGLGLSIVKKIITGHRGKIWVESEVGKGSTFYFSLPLKPA